MTLLLTCHQVTDRLTDYDEGALPRLFRWRMATHLSLCPGCRAFLASLRRIPGLVKAALAEEPETPPEARTALAGALARLGRPRLRVPGPAAETLAAGEALLPYLAKSQAAVAAGLLPREAPYLPAEVLADLPDPNTWRWWSLGLGGARMARLKTCDQGHSDLYLLHMPPGGRFPAHRHQGAESLLVLQGGLEDGTTHGDPGTWFHYTAGHPGHAPVADATGCWALVWAETDAVRLEGWRGWAQRLLG